MILIVTFDYDAKNSIGVSFFYLVYHTLYVFFYEYINYGGRSDCFIQTERKYWLVYSNPADAVVVSFKSGERFHWCILIRRCDLIIQIQRTLSLVDLNPVNAGFIKFNSNIFVLGSSNPTYLSTHGSCRWQWMLWLVHSNPANAVIVQFKPDERCDWTIHIQHSSCYPLTVHVDDGGRCDWLLQARRVGPALHLSQ